MAEAWSLDRVIIIICLFICFLLATFDHRLEDGSLQPSMEEDEDIECEEEDVHANNNTSAVDVELITESSANDVAARFVAC